MGFDEGLDGNPENVELQRRARPLIGSNARFVVRNATDETYATVEVILPPDEDAHVYRDSLQALGLLPTSGDSTDWRGEWSTVRDVLRCGQFPVETRRGLKALENLRSQMEAMDEQRERLLGVGESDSMPLRDAKKKIAELEADLVKESEQKHHALGKAKSDRAKANRLQLKIKELEL